SSTSTRRTGPPSTAAACASRRSRTATASRSAPPRSSSSAGSSPPMVEQVLLALKVCFLVVLYLFVWRVIRLSVRDLRAPQESMVIGAAAAEAAGLGRAAPAPAPDPYDAAHEAPRLVVLSSPVFPPGTLVRLDQEVSFGRAEDCDVVL